MWSLRIKTDTQLDCLLDYQFEMAALMASDCISLAARSALCTAPSCKERTGLSQTLLHISHPRKVRSSAREETIKRGFWWTLWND